jgi:hypothetical protein
MSSSRSTAARLLVREHDVVGMLGLDHRGEAAQGSVGGRRAAGLACRSGDHFEAPSRVAARRRDDLLDRAVADHQHAPARHALEHRVPGRGREEDAERHRDQRRERELQGADPGVDRHDADEAGERAHPRRDPSPEGDGRVCRGGAQADEPDDGDEGEGREPAGADRVRGGGDHGHGHGDDGGAATHRDQLAAARPDPRTRSDEAIAHGPSGAG